MTPAAGRLKLSKWWKSPSAKAAFRRVKKAKQARFKELQKHRDKKRKQQKDE